MGRTSFIHLIGLRMILSSCLLLISISLYAQGGLLQQAQRLILSNEFQQAYDLLKPHEINRAGDPDFDYLFGIAALDSGKNAEAVFALERAWDARPDNPEIRAELARAYFVMGEIDAAKLEFDKLKEEELPGGVQETIDKYLSVIERQFATTRTRYNFHVESSAGYDSNASSATDESEIAIPALGGLLFTLDENGQEVDSAIWDIGAGFSFANPLTPDVTMVGGVSVNWHTAMNASDFSTFTPNGTIGARYSSGANAFSLNIQGQQFHINGDVNRRLGGATVQWQRALSPRDQLTTFAQAAVMRFPEQQVRNVNRYSGGIGWGHVFDMPGAPVLFTSVFAGTELELDGRRKDLGRDFIGLRFGGQYKLKDQLVMRLSMNYQHSSYGDDDPVFQDRREEDNFNFSAGLEYNFTDNFGIRPMFRFSKNDSSIPINEYKRYEFIVMLRNDF
jgi:outer membrane protein